MHSNWFLKNPEIQVNSYAIYIIQNIVFIYESTVSALLVKETAAATWINNTFVMICISGNRQRGLASLYLTHTHTNAKCV